MSKHCLRFSEIAALRTSAIFFLDLKCECRSGVPYGGETALSFAEIVVNTDHVHVVLEIDLSEYPFYVGPEDDAGTSMAARTGQTFSVVNEGVDLPRNITAVGIRSRTERRTATASVASPRPRSEDVVFVELEFPFEGQPGTFTFTPPLDQAGSPVSSLGVLVKHRDVPVTDFRYLSGPETLRPDWNDPWFSRFDNPNMTRHHKSPMMSFLSMEAREVRHEIIFRLRDLETWTELELSDTNTLTAEEIETVLDGAVEFFADKNPVTIDGKVASPASIRASQITVDVEGLRVLDAPSETDRSTALLGVILSYPQRQLAENVEMNWELFPDGVEVVPVTLVDPAGGTPTKATREASVMVWKNALARWQDPATFIVSVDTGSTIDLPIVSPGLGLAGVIAAIIVLKTHGAARGVAGIAGGAAFAASIFALPTTQTVDLPGTRPLDDTAALSIMSGMLDNISTAMLEVEPRQFVASLESFVAENQRSEVATELRRGLSVTLPSGALARTDEIID